MNAFISALPGVFDAIDSSDAVKEAFAFAAWRHVAGLQVSERTTPIKMDAGRLIVAVSDKAWRLNLESLAPQLLFKLNAALGKAVVDYIEFRVDPGSIDRLEPESEILVGDVTPPVEVAISAKGIRDEHLRETVLTAAANCLSRRK